VALARFSFLVKPFLSLGAASFCVAANLVPADAADLTMPANSPGWFVTIGAGSIGAPTFPGSKTWEAFPTGYFDYRRAGDPAPFLSPDDGFGIPLFNLGWLKAGPVGRFVPARGLRNGNEDFYGLHNVGWSLELGGFAEVWMADNHLRTRLELRQAVNGNNGLDANVAIDGVVRTGPWIFSLGPRVQLGNSTYMNAYFGVTPYEASINKIVTPYRAYGGVTSFGGEAAVKYTLSRNWSATIFGGYNRFVNSAAESPIPNKLGSLNQFTAGGRIDYSFDFAGLGILGF